MGPDCVRQKGSGKPEMEVSGNQVESSLGGSTEMAFEKRFNGLLHITGMLGSAGGFACDFAEFALGNELGNDLTVFERVDGILTICQDQCGDMNGAPLLAIGTGAIEWDLFEVDGVFESPRIFKLR